MPLGNNSAFKAGVALGSKVSDLVHAWAAQSEISRDDLLRFIAEQLLAADPNRHSVPAASNFFASALATSGTAAPVATSASVPSNADMEAHTQRVISETVFPNRIVCLECRADLRMLKRHLSDAHGVSPSQYRRNWGLSAAYPMVCEEYSDYRRNLMGSLRDEGKLTIAEGENAGPRAGKGTGTAHKHLGKSKASEKASARTRTWRASA